MQDENTTNHSADEAAVRALYQQLMDGWNQGSGDAFASVFTEDGDLIGFDGTHLKGRGDRSVPPATLRQVAEGEPPGRASQGRALPEP